MPGGPPGAPHLVQARPGGRAWTWCGPPGACLRLFFGLLDASGENRDFCLRGVQFREYFQNNFSKTKNSRKQGTGTGHLVNRLVPENVGKTCENIRKTCSNWHNINMEHQKLWIRWRRIKHPQAQFLLIFEQVNDKNKIISEVTCYHTIKIKQ